MFYSIRRRNLCSCFIHTYKESDNKKTSFHKIIYFQLTFVSKQQHRQQNPLRNRNFILIQSFLGISFGSKTEPEIKKTTRKMSEDGKKLDEIVLHADQLFDENSYTETVELLKSFEVRFDAIYFFLQYLIHVSYFRSYRHKTRTRSNGV